MLEHIHLDYSNYVMLNDIPGTGLLIHKHCIRVVSFYLEKLHNSQILSGLQEKESKRVCLVVNLK